MSATDTIDVPSWVNKPHALRQEEELRQQRAVARVEHRNSIRNNRLKLTLATLAISLAVAVSVHAANSKNSEAKNAFQDPAPPIANTEVMTEISTHDEIDHIDGQARNQVADNFTHLSSNEIVENTESTQPRPYEFQDADGNTTKFTP